MKFESLIPTSVYSKGKHKIKLEAINNMNIFPKDNILNNKETSFKFIIIRHPLRSFFAY